MSTLAELKAENETDDNAETEVIEVVDDKPEVIEDDNGEEKDALPEKEGNEEKDVTIDEEKDGDPDEKDAELNDDWQKGDDDKSEKKHTDGDIGRAKYKLKGKLDKKHTAEMDVLNNRIKELESGSVVSTQTITKPRRADYLESEDPDEAYLDALSEYNTKVNVAEVTATAQANELATQRAVSTAKINDDVDYHYNRAEKLVEASGISEEKYNAADHRVRAMLEGLYPGAGDSLTDAFISKIGKGSEKVMYHLGINDEKLKHYETLLRNDQTGIDAAIWLGGLNKELSTPKKRVTNAPKPTAKMSGDKAVNSTVKSIHGEYDKASKSGDLQAMFNARRAAKAAGVSQKDINGW